MSLPVDPNQDTLAALPLEDLISMYQLTQAVFALYDLKLPDYLHQHGDRSLAELSQSLGTESKVLTPLLEAATTLGLLQKCDQNRYRLTLKGERLRTANADSVVPLLNHHREGYLAWDALSHTLQTGQPAFDRIYQMSIYQYQGQHPEKLTEFNRYMQQTTTAWLTQITDYYNFSGHVVDIGGNTGALMALLLQKFPELQGTVFDLEQALEQTPSVLSAAGVSDRCEIVSGSFFETATIPRSGTIYLISRVLLNWSDEKVVEILKNCRGAMPESSKLIILDFVLSASNLSSTFPLLHSLHLGVMFGARTRHQNEFEELVKAAGFSALHWIEVNETTFLLEAITK